MHIGFEWKDELHMLMMGPTQMPQGSIRNQASNSALAQPAQSNGNCGTDGRTLGHPHKVFTPPTLPNTRKGPAAVMQAINEWFAYQDWLQLAMTTHQHDQLAASSVGIALTGMAEDMAIIKPMDIPLPSSAPKKATKRFSWTASFLTQRKIA